ncbi:two-component system response regulator [Chitinilyticum litopenaei]|uniref:Two-component system response regulator n=2 Tax=Chitinilyticum piscinae TaxID=2866724 RepID=A0A8J7FEE2_9NEIS|nr:two-component system response regulator [Chitinilyticum piscinae]
MQRPATDKALLLIVDDTPANLEFMDELLATDYRVKVAPSGARALKLAHADPQPDLILLDIMMPDMDGLEVCRQLKADPATAHIPVIFLTARTDPTDEAFGLAIGAVDYILKPVSPPIVHARVRTQLALKAAADFLRDRNSYLEQEVQRRTEEAQRRADDARIAQEMTMIALASIAETRDNETGNHILRTQHYVRALALQARQHPRFAAELSDEQINLLFRAAPLHDIGKVGIPDRILLKPGKLTPEEFEIMKRHTTLGFAAIERTQLRVGQHAPVLDVAGEIALSHQEKWDGTGYPHGLAGDAIPLSARLMAVADVYDALISRRVYKPAFSHARALEIMAEGRGSHFDPDLLDAFVLIQQEFAEIAARYAETDADLEHLAHKMEAFGRA